ncbi:MAG: LptA/OstA family protein, partial [Terriglobales bacterium]
PAPRHGPAARLPQLATVSSRGRTHLVRGPLRAASDHLELTLAANQQPRLAIATGNVRLRQTLHGVERDSQAQRLQIEFATALHRSPQPRQVIESGGVQLRIGQRQLSAQRLVYTPGDGKAVLTGGVRGSSPQASFAAQAATWISRPDGSATLIAHAAPSRHIELSLSGRTPDFGPMLTANRPVVVTASSLHWSQPPAPGPAAPRPSLSHAAAPALGFRGTAVFTGSVRLLQAPNLLRADQLTLISGARGAPSGLVASGHVHTDFVAAGTAVAGLAKTAYSSASKSQEKPRDVQVQAAHLHYSVASRQARYTGGVSLTLDNAVLTAPQLDLYLSASARAPALERAQASGGVRVRQPGRRAHADRLSFDFAKDQIRLDGGPPSILDAEQGKITGDPLTFSLSSDEIQVGGKPGTRVLGKTKGHN